MASHSPIAAAAQLPFTSPADRLIEAARLELARNGLRGMSFRRLGEAVGATAGALTYHLGAKADILSDVVEGERRRERLRHSAWLERFQAATVLDARAIATILEHILEEASVGEARTTQLVWSDLMLRAPIDGDVARLMRPWLAERRAFWTALFKGRVEDEDTWPLVAAAFVADESIHGLVLGQNADYRLLRRTVIDRVAHRLRPERRGGLEGAFSTLVDRLDPRAGLPGRGEESDLTRAGRRQDIAMAACRVLLEQGVDAVTHRAVSTRAGVSATAPAYYFRSVADLLKAALTMIYLIAEGRMPAPGIGQAGTILEQRGLVAVRGTLPVALAAARDPTLADYAIDLRRRRGINYVHVLREAGDARIDALDGQAASLVAIGAAALAGIDGEARALSLVDWLTQFPND